MSDRPRLALAANAIGFQCVWLLSVAGAGAGHGWIGPIAAALFAAMTLAWFGRARSDLALLMLVLPFGFVLDSLWVGTGLLDFAAAWPWSGFAPAWILALWVGFTLTINHSLAGLRRHPWLAAMLGGIGGPLAYFGAAHGFGAVVWSSPSWVVAACLGVAWAVAVPAMLALAHRLRFHGHQKVARTAP